MSNIPIWAGAMNDGKASTGDRVLRAAALARNKLSGLLSEHVGDGGRVEGPCRSRVLESALMLHLLRTVDLHPARAQRITAFLRRRKPDLTGLDALITDAALRAPLHVPAHTPVLGSEHSARKKILLTTILAVLGATPFDPELDLDRLDYREQAIWTQVVLCSAKILNAYGTDRRDKITHHDRAFLTDQLTRGSRRCVWEGHVPAHLLALLAINRFQPNSVLIPSGIAAILRHQRDDGGLPFILDMTTCLTALTGLGLARADADRTLLIRMGNELAALQAPDGGWPYTHDVAQTDSDSASWALQFLSRTDIASYKRGVARANGYYRSLANADGGYPTYRHGHESETAMTAGAVIALAGHPPAAPLRTRAATYLLKCQQPEGTFERSWSLSESFAIYRVLDALHDAPPDTSRAGIQRLRNSAHAYLRGAQNADAGWGHRPGSPSDPISTAHALLALHRLNDTTAIGHGLIYLLDQQAADGTYQSLPEQAAPRPIPYDIPLLANAFPLLALATVTPSECIRTVHHR